MKIILSENEISEALEAYVATIINVGDDQNLEISYPEAGVAEIDVVGKDANQTPEEKAAGTAPKKRPYTRRSQTTQTAAPAVTEPQKPTEETSGPQSTAPSGETEPTVTDQTEADVAEQAAQTKPAYVPVLDPVAHKDKIAAAQAAGTEVRIADAPFEPDTTAPTETTSEASTTTVTETTTEGEAKPATSLFAGLRGRTLEQK